MKKTLLTFMLTGLILSSCGTAVMSTRGYSYNVNKEIKKHSVNNESKKYKKMKACEEKFMKRFMRFYTRQQNRHDNSEITTPFFSTNAN